MRFATGLAPVLSRNTGFVLVAYAFLVTMIDTTLPTPLHPLFEQRYSFGELTVTVIFAVAALVLTVLASLARSD